MIIKLSAAVNPSFCRAVPEVWQSFNHNWLRITRILRSLCLLGLPAEAQALYACLADWYQQWRFPIPADTFRYWTEAVQSTPLRRETEKRDEQ
jgi:hypothetical protein